MEGVGRRRDVRRDEATPKHLRDSLHAQFRLGLSRFLKIEAIAKLRPVVNHRPTFVPSAANCFRYAITSDISRAFVSPEKIIFVPGTTLAGARR